MAGPLSVAPQPNEITERTLAAEGFSPDEIAHLRDLREVYPYIEYVDSRRQWHRLRFVKWLYLKGELER